MAYTYSIDATVETSKNGTGGYVNMRASTSTSATVVERISSGTKIKVETLSGDWLPAKHGTKTGYIMAKFIAESDVYKGSSSGGSTGGGSTGGDTGGSTGGGETGEYKYPLTVETDRNGNDRRHGANLRDKASTSGKSLKVVACGKTVYASKKDGEWLPVKYGSLTGYMMAKLLSGSDVYNAPPTGADKTAKYDRDKAVEYAMTYSSNDKGTDSYNNSQYKPIGDSPTNINKDCANFVSQCLFAGGIPMDDTWYYNDPGNVKNPQISSAWKGTNSQERALAKRHFGERVYNISLLKRGDIVYTYDSSNNGSYSHVVILSEDVGKSSSMTVCGHTQNQKSASRAKKNNDLYFHIYDSIPVKSSDRFA